MPFLLRSAHRSTRREVSKANATVTLISFVGAAKFSPSGNLESVSKELRAPAQLATEDEQGKLYSHKEPKDGIHVHQFGSWQCLDRNS